MLDILSFFGKFIIPLLFYQCAYSVNILTWWGYFDDTVKTTLEKECKTSISFDEYFTNGEFLRRMNSQKYSIIIFPSNSYYLIKDKIKNTGINLKEIKKNYHPNILPPFKKHNIPENIALFALGIPGFLYNYEKISISKDENIYSIFKKAKNKNVVILDNPIESLNLISNPKNVLSLSVFEGIEKFKNLVLNAKVIIANDNANAVRDKNYMFSFAWIGEAYTRIYENPDLKLKFISHSKTSYLNSDLIASLDKSPKSSCVINILAGKKMLNTIMAKKFYFSPYGEILDSPNSEFIKESNDFYKLNYENMDWLYDALKKEEHLKLINVWQRMKLSIK